MQLVIRSESERLDARLLARPGAPVVLFCHGFPGIHRHEDLARALHAAGLAVVLLSYRGVDGSTGLFNFRDAITDVRAALRELAGSSIGAAGIGVFAYSAGAYYAVNAVAGMQAAPGRDGDGPPVRAICALSPVVDLPRTARLDFENIYGLMLDAPAVIRVAGVHDLVASFAEVWRDHHALDRIRALVEIPLLVIDGDDERYGDPVQARMLYDAAPGPKALRILGGAGHYFASPQDRLALRGLLVDFFTREFGHQPSPAGVVPGSDDGNSGAPLQPR